MAVLKRTGNVLHEHQRLAAPNTKAVANTGRAAGVPLRRCIDELGKRPCAELQHEVHVQ